MHNSTVIESLANRFGSSRSPVGSSAQPQSDQPSYWGTVVGGPVATVVDDEVVVVDVLKVLDAEVVDAETTPFCPYKIR
jgi:hypothetical protein